VTTMGTRGMGTAAAMTTTARADEAHLALAAALKH